MVRQEPRSRARVRERAAARLTTELDKNLRAYSGAANAARVGTADRDRRHYGAAVTAAGLGMAVLAFPAEAKIVYKAANVKITSVLHLDVNGDGVNDFTLYFFGSVHLTSATGSFLSVVPSNFSHNGIIGKLAGSSYAASALRAGVPIGDKNNFRGFAMAQRWRHSGKGTSTFRDPWANHGKGVTNRFLGLKFEIKKTNHYGWARLSVRPRSAVATLTGYAYETVPNRPITTGEMKGGGEMKGSQSPSLRALKARSHEPAGLGVLAQGAAGLAVRRRKEEAAAH